MKKKILSAVLCGAMMFSLAACGNSEAENTTAGTDSSVSDETVQTESNEELEKITFALDWTPNTNHTGLYVADALGYFEEAGFEVEFVQASSGYGSELVGAGQAEFGIDFQDTLAYTFSAENPIPVTAVAAVIQHNTSGIVTLAADGVESPKDLEGLHYATWETPMEQALMKYVVEADGGNFDNVILDPVTVEDAAAALQSNIDAVWIYYAWDGIATELAGVETNFFQFKDYCEEMDAYTPVIVANNDYLAENPERATAFMNAVKKGYEYAISDPKSAAEILCEEVPELDEELVTASQTWLADQYQADAAYWGYIDQERWDSCYKWCYDQQLIEKEIPAGYGFSNDYMDAE